jgi:SAM-dependent methyltransferase
VIDNRKIMRRVAGYHDLRLDGMMDLVVRARGASVFDVGCNRGLVGFEMANNGAEVVHGCDNYAEGIKTAQELFVDLRAVQSLFAVVDLAKGPSVLKPFFRSRYDIVLVLATYHKLKRIMPANDLTELMIYLGRSTAQYLGWRGTSDKPAENEEEIANLDRDLGKAGLSRIHTSYISHELGVAAIWARG